MKQLTVIACVISVLLAGCGGRNANPVAVEQMGDKQKNCEVLRAEMSGIEAQVAALIPESQKTGKNVALGTAGIFLIVPFFFMDLGHAEQAEIDAYRKRYTHLQMIAAEKKCGE